jgi:hypothetical protein
MWAQHNFPLQMTYKKLQVLHKLTCNFQDSMAFCEYARWDFNHGLVQQGRLQTVY